MLTDSREFADLYDSCAKRAGDPKAVANWLTGEFLRLLNAKGVSIAEAKITPVGLAELLEMVDAGKINRNTAKAVFDEMFTSGKSAADIVKARGLEQVSDTSAIEAVIDSIIAENPKEVERFRGGEDKLVGWFVGQVMRQMKGKANPGVINQVLKGKLEG